MSLTMINKDKVNNNLHNHAGDHMAIIIMVLILLVSLWFRDSKIFAGGEGSIPFYNIEKTARSSSSMWIDSQVGYPNVEGITQAPIMNILLYMNKAGIDTITLQALTFFVLMFCGVVSVYFLLKVTLGREFRDSIFLIGSLFYLFNPYSMVQVWGRGLYPQFFSFALFPICLLLYIQSIKKKNVIYLITLVLTTLMFSISFSNFSYVISFFFMITAYFLYAVITSKSDKIYIVANYTFLFISFVLVHLWWIYPNIISINSIISNRTAGVEENLGTLRGVSMDTGLSVVFRFLHKFVLVDKIYGGFYSRIPYTALGWTYPLLFLISLKIFSKTKIFWFYLFLFLTTLFVSLGSNPPLGRVFEFLFSNIYPLQAFRNPYEKIGIVLVLSMTPFFAIGFNYLSLTLSKYLKVRTKYVEVVFGILMFVLYVWPIWYGNFAGGFKFNPWVEVPNDYSQINNYLSQRGYERVIHLPINQGDGLKYTWKDGGYQGTDPSYYLIDNHSISKNVVFNKKYYNLLLERFGKFTFGLYGPDPDIRESKLKSEKFASELANLGVGWIILHFDIDNKINNTQDSMEVKNILQGQDNIIYEQTFGDLELYRVSGIEISKELSLDGDELKYNKISDSEYELDLLGSSENLRLILLSNFDPLWKAYLNGNELQHDEYLSFANSWEIPEKASGKIKIEYLKQSQFKSALSISKLYLSLLVVLMILRYKIKVYN